MIERSWFNPKWYDCVMWPLLWPLSRAYAAVADAKAAKFNREPESAYRPAVPVIVVGNITAGGNGKTPVVIAIVEYLQQQGFKPGVISRGYGGKAPCYPHVVSDKDTPTVCGDEPLLIHLRTGVTVVVAPERARAAQQIEQMGVDVIVTDDGLQHYALDRDIEIVVVDGERRFGNGHRIPLGPLREGVERLASVDFVICNGGEAQSGEYPMHLVPQEWVNVRTKARASASHFSDAVAMAGIGHPPRFFATVAAQGISLQATQAFEDHQPYSEAMLADLVQSPQPLLMTEKDAVKCYSFAHDNWWYLPVNAELPDSLFTQLITKLKEIKD
uniref:tetraacyldisaccharide 4'-kinase n=1 Tax=Thaumasiovibrio occultus TaxID=1891184 RepID=UPI000B361788|nr:tetraacyldisaccharide 4'-kinase [Thaumasiovibrio occultus]